MVLYRQNRKDDQTQRRKGDPHGCCRIRFAAAEASVCRVRVAALILGGLVKVMKNSLHGQYEFRSIRPEEAEEAADIEQICFPPNEACSREMMLQRAAIAPEQFLVAVDRDSGKIAGFLNGLATDERDFRDAFFTDAGLHDPQGKTVMLCGLDVLPEYRGKGLARELVSIYSRRERERGRERLVLTCLDSKVDMYRKMGFRDLGESASVWGGEKWNDMERYLT